MNGRGEAPIYCRITLDGKRAQDFSTGVVVRVSDWNAKKQQCKSEVQNARLRSIRDQLDYIFLELDRSGKIPTASEVKMIFQGKSRVKLSFLQVVDLYLKSVTEKHNRGQAARRTVSKYQNFQRICRHFLKGKVDLPAESFDFKFARDLLKFAGTLGQGHETANRTVKHAKIVLQWALQNGYIESNPLFQWKGESSPAKEIVYLDQAELDRIIAADLSGRPGLARARDLFLFQCYTGLDYGCCSTFVPADHIRRDPAGRLWILKPRHKNGHQAALPVFPEALEILQRYQGADLLGPVCKLPKFSNQKYNLHLKELAAIAGIDKLLSSHIGRKTFGTLALNKGFTIVAVSRMLGHRFTKTTETHYARVLASRVEMEFDQMVV